MGFLIRVTVFAASSLWLLAVAFPQPAFADVLVNAPLTNLCLGHTIDVGVWDRDAAATSFEVKIFGPNGSVIFQRAGAAPPEWRIWHVLPRQLGTYRVEYYPSTPHSTFTSTVRRPNACFSGFVAG